MKESRREKNYNSDKHKKKKNKKYKKHEHSSSSDSEDFKDKMQWVEASPPRKASTKKENKKKKHKNKKHRSSSSSDSESSSSGVPRVEPSSVNSAPEKRDSWMNEESFVPTLSKDEMLLSRSHQKRQDSLKKKLEKEEEIKNNRELNPHWKKSGTGLPEKEADIESLSLPSTSVGDGGYSWLKKAYYRIQEQAQKEGRSMEEVAVERWGSLSKLESMIKEAEDRMQIRPDRRHSGRGRDDYDACNQRSYSGRFKKPHDNHESERYSFDSPFEFKKPSDNNNKDRKTLNRFKSCRKSYSYEHSDEIKESDTSNSSSDSKYTKRKSIELSDIDKSNHSKSSSDRESRIPAWKKPKFAKEKNKEKEVFQESIQETSNNASVMKDAVSVEDGLPIIYCDEDLSRLAAKQIKAEIRGDTSLALELKQQLDEARQIVKEKGFAKRPPKQVEEIILSKLDSQGQIRPIHTSQDKIADYKQKKSNKNFDDGSKYSLKQMFEREKLTTVDDQIEMFVEATAKCDDTKEIDFELGNVSKKLSQKLAVGREEEKDIARAMHQHQKHTTALEKCEYCLDQPRMKKYLIVDIGEQVYLCLPNFQIMTEGHCLIVPKAHVSSFLFLEENEASEVEIFKSHLRNLFRQQNKSVIFLETSMNFRHCPHAVVECIPVPEEEGDMAPFYFKKAIQDCEAEWANNKKLIDLKKGLRYSVPKNLPYFHVEFDPKVHAGFAHVIEDEKCFPRNFGKEVVGGMLEINYNNLYKNKKEDPLKKSNEVAHFTKLWKLQK